MTCRTSAYATRRAWDGETADVGGILERIWAYLLNWQGRALDRHHAETLSDHLLRDIGLTRSELRRALR
jgi:uncharacterized protein YjiS (DUF1127 family)